MSYSFIEVLHIRQIASTGTPRLDKLSIAGKELLNDHQRKSKTFSPLHLFYYIHASISFFLWSFYFFIYLLLFIRIAHIVNWEAIVYYSLCSLSFI